MKRLLVLITTIVFAATSIAQDGGRQEGERRGRRNNAERRGRQGGEEGGRREGREGRRQGGRRGESWGGPMQGMPMPGGWPGMQQGGAQPRPVRPIHELSRAALLQRADVQKELAITDEQRDKLRELQNERRQPGQDGTRSSNGLAIAAEDGSDGRSRRRGFRGGQDGQSGQVDRGTRGERGSRGGGRGMSPQREGRLLQVLTPEQTARLNEIYIQVRGNRALLERDVQEQLGFTPAQKFQLSKLQQALRNATEKLRERLENRQIEQHHVDQISQKNDQIMNAELGKLLSRFQWTKFQALTGKPFQPDAGASTTPVEVIRSGN